MMSRIASLLAFVLISGLPLAGSAQSSEAVPPIEHRWTLYGGIGPNFYFNNLEVGKDRVNEVNYSFIARMMWEPEHKLSLGFETGYIRLYSIKGTTAALGDVDIANIAIPLQLVISMKFFKRFYGNFSLGQTILLNEVSSSKHGNFDATTVSLGDFGATIGYKKAINERLYMGAELKAYYAAKLDDKNMSLLFMTGYRLW
jgi:hypothetical protein